MSKPVTITGNAGKLEATLARAARNTRRVAVLCHPHPQFGGSMDDAVVAVAEDVLLAEGVDSLRFNFRGVGASQGSFDSGKGRQSTWNFGFSFSIPSFIRRQAMRRSALPSV